MTRSKFLGILAGAVGLTTALSCKKKLKPSEVDGWDKASNETFQDNLRKFVEKNRGNKYTNGKVVKIGNFQWTEVSLSPKTGRIGVGGHAKLV